MMTNLPPQPLPYLLCMHTCTDTRTQNHSKWRTECLFLLRVLASRGAAGLWHCSVFFLFHAAVLQSPDLEIYLHM